MSEKTTHYDTATYPTDDEIDLRDLILVLWRHRWLITAVFVAAVFTAGVISFAMAPVYQVYTLIALGKYDSPIYTTQGPAREVILSDDFIRTVVDDLKLDVPREEFRAFKNTISVEPVEDTNMLKITIETKDRAEGRLILERIYELYLEQGRPHFERQKLLVAGQLETIQQNLVQVESNIALTNTLLTRIESAGGGGTVDQDFRRSQLLESIQALEQQRLALLDRHLDLQRELHSLETAQVVRSPYEPVYPVKPNKKLNVALAGVLGLMVGVFLAFGVEFCRRNPLELRQE